MKYIRNFLTALCLCALFCVSALAANEGFNAGLTVDRTNETNGSFTVTIVSSEANNSILAEQQPTLSVPCSYPYAKVTGPNGDVDANVADGMVSFTVVMGGTYTITELSAPIVTVTVTFDPNGGSCTTVSAPCDIAGKLAELPTPTRGGYWYFTGWYTAKSGGTEVTTETVFTKDTTIYAQWYYDEPYYPSVPVTPPTTTEKVENEDGSTTTTVTDNKTGTVTETTENADGSTTTVETQKDGTVTETVENTDGSTQVTETKAEVAVKEDGSTETVTISTTTATDAAGNVTTSTTTATETTTVTDEGATVTEKVEETKSESAEATVETKTTATTTATEEKTETVAVTEETVTKTDGTVETKTTTTTETALADGTTGTAVTDESGKTEATVTISEEAAASEEPVALPIPAVTTTTESEAASTITVTTNSEEDTTVSIPVAEVNTSTVAVIVNEDGTETVITETKMTDEGLVIDVPDGATVKIVDNSTDFHDVEDHHWEEDAIDFASARGLVNGVGNNLFDKDGITTRAHVVTLLARLAGVDTTPDEGETWYDKGHDWAVENGITYAGNMNGAITRHEMMTLLWRYMGSPKSDHDISHFTDIDGLTAVTEPAARWAVEIGLVGGHGNGTMTPTDNVTRGQLAQFMMNFVQLT